MRVLTIENVPEAGGQCVAALEGQNDTVTRVLNREDAVRIALTQDFELIIIDGYTVQETATLCTVLRKSGVNTGVVARLTESNRLACCDVLDAGADDFVCGPTSIDELLARIRALSRRCGVTSEAIVFGPFLVDPNNRYVAINGEPVDMTGREIALLALLARRAGAVVSRSDIVKHVWKRDKLPSSNLVDVNIRHLRSKLGDAASHLKTVRGRGYMLQ